MPHATAADDTALYYEVEGAGPPLVLLAGQSNDHHWWDLTRPGFAAHFRVVTMDWRGTGDSGKPDRPYTTRGFAADVIAVLDHAIGPDARAHVYGTSMGGRVAQWLAADHPSRVDRLVLGATSPGRPHGVERDRDTHRALADRDPAVARRALVDLMYTPAWTGPRNTLGSANLPGYARRRHFAASTAHDGWDALARITAPTLVVHGADDRFNPAANAEIIAGRIPGAEMHLIPGARHAYFDEFREVATPLVVEFLHG